MTEDASCETEIKARIGMAKANFGKIRDLLTNLSQNPRLRERMISSYI